MFFLVLPDQIICLFLGSLVCVIIHFSAIPSHRSLLIPQWIFCLYWMSEVSWGLTLLAFGKGGGGEQGHACMGRCPNFERRRRGGGQPRLPSPPPSEKGSPPLSFPYKPDQGADRTFTPPPFSGPADRALTEAEVAPAVALCGQALAPLTPDHADGSLLNELRCRGFEKTDGRIPFPILSWSAFGLFFAAKGTPRVVQPSS